MNRKLLTIIGIIFIVCMGFMIAGCDAPAPSVDTQQRVQQDKVLQEMNRQLGLPEIANFQEKKLFKSIIELRDRSDLVTYSYTKSEYSGKFTYLGKSIGFGIPAATQYTNPERIAYKSSYGVANLPQADPNGLFMPDSTAATWVLLVNPATGKPEPMYIESDLTVTLFKLPRNLVDPSTISSDY